MTLKRHNLYDEIDAQQAVALWATSGGNTRECTGYAYKDDKVIVAYPMTLTRPQFDILAEKADKLDYWHFGYNKGCGRNLHIHIGETTISVDVKSEYTLDRPNYVD